MAPKSRSDLPEVHTTESAPSRNYDPAFTEDDAKIVLQSSDGVFYRLHSFTLRTTSGFFRGMMTLPGPDSGSPNHDDSPITLDEKSEVLGRLMRMISGFEIPMWKSFDEVEELVVTAYKYDMPGPQAAARSALKWQFASEQPLRSYAVAARYGWEEEAKLASKLTLFLSLHDDEHTTILERVPSAWLLRLFRLHRARREGFKQHIMQNNVFFGITHCKCRRLLSLPAHDALSLLARLMISVIDLCPAGVDLQDRKWKKWPEAKTCLQSTTCTYAACTSIDTHEDQIASAIKTALQSLPFTI